MSMLRKVIKAKQEASKQFAKYRKVAKAITASVDTTDSCKCATRPGYFWVKEYGQHGGYFQVFNTGVQDRVGMPVLTGIEPQSPFRRVIFSIDWGEVPLIFDDDDIPPGAYDLPAHAASHEWSDADPGTDIVNVYQRAIVPLRAQYTDGMKLQVAPALYFDNDDLKMFMGQEVAVTLYVPSSSGNHKRVLLYLNPDTDSIQVQDQVEVDDGAEAIYDDPPAGTLPVAWVYLQYGDTGLVDSDITDARVFLSVSLGAVDLSQLLTVEHHLEIDYNKHFDALIAGTAFGEIFVTGNVVETAIALSGKANRVQVIVFDTNGASNNATPDHTNDHITITKAGTYMVNVCIHANSPAGGSAVTFGWSIYKNNGTTEIPNLHSHRGFSGGGSEAGSSNVCGMASLEVGDTIELWCWNEDDAQNVVNEDIGISIFRLG